MTKLASVIWAGLTMASLLGAPARAAAPQCEPFETSASLASLQRGFNLTGWLDSETPRRVSSGLLAALRKLGFTHVRLPFNGEFFMPAFRRGREGPAMVELDRALDALAAAGFVVSLDMHPGAEFGHLLADSPEAGMIELKAAWSDVIEHTRRRSPKSLLYEVLNEPALDPAAWKPRLADMLAFMRALAPRHTLVAEPGGPQRIDALEDMTASDDPNVVYAVHFYDPMYFTHQGLDWDPGNPLERLADVPFPATKGDERIRRLFEAMRRKGQDREVAAIDDALSRPWTAEEIDKEFAKAEAWSHKNRRAVNVNEFGVLRYKAAPGDRAVWLNAVRTAAERHCVGWTHWEYRDAFGFINPADGKPDALTIKSLLGADE
jgi:endoglucanase